MNYYQVFGEVARWAIYLYQPHPNSHLACFMFPIFSSSQLRQHLDRNCYVISEGANTMDIGRTMLENFLPRHRYAQQFVFLYFGDFGSITGLMLGRLVQWVLALGLLLQLQCMYKIQKTVASSQEYCALKEIVLLDSLAWNMRQHAGSQCPFLKLIE